MVYEVLNKTQFYILQLNVALHASSFSANTVRNVSICKFSSQPFFPCTNPSLRDNLNESPSLLSSIRSLNARSVTHRYQFPTKRTTTTSTRTSGIKRNDSAETERIEL